MFQSGSECSKQLIARQDCGRHRETPSVRGVYKDIDRLSPDKTQVGLNVFVRPWPNDL